MPTASTFSRISRPAPISWSSARRGGYRFAPRDQGGDDALDSDIDPLTGRTATNFLPLNATNRTWDAGLYRPAAVGDFTWDDLHVNGIQELGEPGLTGLVVRLYGAASNLLATTTSGVDGAYAFTDLAPGTYFLGFTNPPLYRFTLRDQGGDEALDSDADPATGRTAPLTLVSGQTDASRDAGFYQPATLGDFAWHDLNANGLQDGGSETGLPGVVVTLYDAATNALATTTSGLSGAYAFTDLATGTYLLEFAPPAGYWISPRDQGGNDALDSDADSATGRTVPFTVTAGASALTWDAGFFRPAALGDFAWDDRNANGLQDGGSETGLPGVVVALYDAATNLLATTTSGVSGAYAFADLVPGTYLLGFAAPSAYRITLRDQGGNDALDSDPDRSTGLTAAFTLVSGQNATNWDAGFYLPVSVGDFVWHDVNENGLQDGGSETGMPAVVVHLYGPTTNLLATTNTDASGSYAFTNRPPGTYLLGAMAPEGFTFTLRDQGGNDALDSDFSPVTGRTSPFYLAPGTNDPHRDLGLVTITYGLSLSKTADAIACLAAGETITYTMLIENTGTVAMAGIVLEDELPPGLAYVSNSVTWTGGSLATSGPPPELLANLTLSVGESATVTFQATPELPSPVTQLVNVASAYSAVQPAIFAAVTNCVQFADVGVEKTASTLRPDPEQTIEFVLVATNRGPDAATGLRIADLLPDELEYASHSNGAYNAWTGIWDIGTLAAYASTTLYVQATVIEDTYGLRITNMAAVAERDLYDPDPGNDASAVVVVPRGATFAGLAWEDMDGNGQQDPGEPPLAGVAVNLYDAGDALAGVRTTSAAGAYAFIDVPPGTYTLGFVSPAGYRFTRQDLGPDATDSDPDPVTGRTAPIALAGGETNDVVAAGFYRSARVGDRVWFDQNLDGLQNPAETNGISNLWVELLDTNASVVAGTFTSDEGLYLFEDLAPGTYLVRFDLSDIFAHSWITLPNQGGDDALDSDATILDGSGRAWTELFALASGQTNLLVDLGLRPQKSTRAELAEVWGEWSDGQGRVAWHTESEWGTAGFFVYRLDAESGAETRLNEVLVPSVFEPAGASYGLVDPAAKAGAAGRYRLEEVELSGQVQDLGEHAVVFGPPPPATARAAAVRTVAAASPLPAAPPAAAGPAAALRATFRGEGIYGIALAALASGFGLETFEAEELAAEGGFAFAAGGSPVPVAYDPVRARLLFHGRPPDDWYVRDNAVLISIGAGTAMPQRDPVGMAGQTQLPATIRFEQDRYPFDSALEKPEDFYYWDYVISGTNATSLREFPLDLRGRTGAVTLKVRLQGWSSTTNEPDHRAEFRFNGAPAGAATFDDQDVRIVEWTVPAEDVLDGVNVLSVKGVLPPGRSHSYFVVDWIEAAFERELRPTAGTAHYRCAGQEAVSAAAFAEPVALALDGENRPTWIADETGQMPGKAWQVLPGDARFAVAEAATVPMLVPGPAAADAWFLSATNRIDYLVVASRALAETARTLVDYRAGQGLRAGLAIYEDVCDLLADGLRTPEAIPELLAYANALWAESPWLVVLAGNGHYDYLGALSNEVNHLPPMLLQTQDGIFASDGLLANNGGDDLPDVAIGRLPARNAADLAAMIAKIKAYEASFGQAWQNQIVLAADTNDVVAGDFAVANAQLSRLAGSRYPVARIDLNATPINPARASLTNWFKAGAGFIHYTGHGGVNNWSGKGLLKAADVNAMNNSNRPAAVTALSCLMGRFEAPGVDSLGELLMRKSGGGAAAVWGPSGLSRNQHALELGEAFYRAVLQDGAGTLGLAILRARRHLADAGAPRDTFDIYNLLGDPALRIAGNRNAGAAADNFAQWRWERLTPADLAAAEFGPAAPGLFAEYALGDAEPLEAELPEFGYALPEEGAEDGFILRWKRRVKRADVEYKLSLSCDLETWTDDPANLEEVGAAADPDGVMETVRTRVKRGAAERTFLGIRAQKK